MLVGSPMVHDVDLLIRVEDFVVREEDYARELQKAYDSKVF